MQYSWLFTLALVTAAHAAPLQKSSKEPIDFYDPRMLGGSFLDQSGGAGEPLNVIISGRSSPEVLTPSGFLNYARAVGLSIECLGLHKGDKQRANLGDGHGWVEEREVLREYFNVPVLGACVESLVGGNHLRTFRQNGPDGNSGALFLAVSQELDLEHHHSIVPNGYDIGRDRFVDAAEGTTQFLYWKYETTVQSLSGFLQPGAQGVNHGIAQDGIIKLLTVNARKIFEE